VFVRAVIPLLKWPLAESPVSFKQSSKRAYAMLTVAGIGPVAQPVAILLGKQAVIAVAAAGSFEKKKGTRVPRRVHLDRTSAVAMVEVYNTPRQV
jgi:hypothetical protein